MTILEYSAGDHAVPGLAQTPRRVHRAFSWHEHGNPRRNWRNRHRERVTTQDTPGTVTLHTASGAESIGVDVSDDLYHINVRAFAAAVRGEGRPTATGEDGLRALPGCPRCRAITEIRTHRGTQRPRLGTGLRTTSTSTESTQAPARDHRFQSVPSRSARHASMAMATSGRSSSMACSSAPLRISPRTPSGPAVTLAARGWPRSSESSPT